MSKEMKELDLEDLEEITGGASGRYERYKVRYEDPETGENGSHELEGTYYQSAGKLQAEADGQKWCIENNKIFIRVSLIV